MCSLVDSRVMPVFHDLVSLGVREDRLGEVWTGTPEYLLLAGLLVVLTSCVFSCRLPSDASVP